MKNIKGVQIAKAVAVGSLVVAAGSANAALPEAAAAAMAGISTFVDDIMVAAWGIAAAVTLGFVGIKLFKKGANKAS